MLRVALFAFAALSSTAFAASETKTLLQLAREKFAPRELTAAEEQLFIATEAGTEAFAPGPGDKLVVDPARDLPGDRIIHAESLAWLCIDRTASALVTHRGVQVFGARIEGTLDLADAQIGFPFRAHRCAINGEMLLLRARMRVLDLQGCSIKALDCDSAQIDGNALLRDGFTSSGKVNFIKASIHGNLECDAASGCLPPCGWEV